MTKSNFAPNIKDLFKSPIVRDSITTTILNTAGKAVGFLIPFFIAAWFGISKETDAFFFAYGIIIFFSTIFSPVVETIIVPFIAEARAQKEDIGHFIGKILGVSGLGIFALSVFLVLLTKPGLSLFTPFEPQQIQKVFILLLETTPLLLLLVWTSIISGTINAYKKFVMPAVSPAIRAIINLCIIFAFRDILGVHAVALGYIIGELIRLAVLLIFLKTQRLFRLKISFTPDPKMLEFLRTASFQIFGMIAVSLNPFIDKVMATWLAVGSVTLIEYAERLYLIPLTIFYSGFAVVILTYFSDRYYQSRSKAQLRSDLNQAVIVAAICSAVVMIGLLLLHKPIARIAYGRGEFPIERLKDVQALFLYLLLGLVPTTINFMLVRGLIILKNTKSLFKALIIRNGLKLIFNLVFVLWLGLKGIALSTSLTALLLMVYLTLLTARLTKDE